ncbi:DUF6944 family repetitive protein [Gracilibacillus dipsosauri]|uniref:Uncharacterized protein n=1 Tax=Gracilibacillus dipsosauri TaxID=178340 RepID=A0A317L0F5_9BACI|nr:hypothetical protein [Gracilibacillus dipsosauri]PWU68734.1 hypothetical protein DLJ74_09930 [Gracilibacillus dipsosauri]
MSKEDKELFGGWIQAIGTILSAIANTPHFGLSQTISQDLKVVGNTMQATGNALAVDKLSQKDLSDVGNAIQSIGNLTVIGSLKFPVSNQLKQGLNIKGNLLQALGSGISFSDSLKDSFQISTVYNAYGNLLQAIGNSMQALASKAGSNSTMMNTIGNWIQAIGAIMTAISESLEKL